MQFRLRQMEIFRAVMLTGSMKGAAKLLSLSHPAVSRGIAHTEICLGYPLFERVKGRLCPTEEAKALIADVESCYLHALQVNDLAASLRNGSAGSLTICASHCLSRGMVARAVAQFLSLYPKVRVQLRACTLADMPRMLLSNQADLAVAVLPLEHVDLQAEVLISGRMVCVMPQGHAFSSRERISLQDLTNVSVIAPHPSIAFGQLIEAMLDQSGVTLNVRVDVWHMDVACALVAEGVGVALLDEFTVQGLPYDRLCVVPIAEDIFITPAVLRSAQGVARPYVAPFIKALKDQVAEDRATAAFRSCQT